MLRTNNVKTVYSPQTTFVGGIKNEWIDTFKPSPGPLSEEREGIGQKYVCSCTAHLCKQVTHQIWLDTVSRLGGDSIMDKNILWKELYLNTLRAIFFNTLAITIFLHFQKVWG